MSHLGVQRENVKCLKEDLKAPLPVVANTIELDFLGKDSVKYLKQVVVNPKVYQLIGKWVPLGKANEGVVMFHPSHPLHLLCSVSCALNHLKTAPFPFSCLNTRSWKRGMTQ
jgi:hypothetical protein